MMMMMNSYTDAGVAHTELLLVLGTLYCAIPTPYHVSPVPCSLPNLPSSVRYA